MDWTKTIYKPYSHWFVDYIAEVKASNKIWGSGFFAYSRKRQIDIFLQTFIKENNLIQFFYKQEKIFSKYGNSVMWLEKDKKFKTFKIRMNNPLFPIYVKMDGESFQEVICVESRKRSTFNQVAYQLIKLTPKSIQYSYSAQQPQMLATTQQFVLKKYQPTTNKMFVYSLNMPRFNPYFININFSNPDTINLNKDDYDKLDNYFNMVEQDQYVSQNRIIAKDRLTYNKDMPENEAKFLKNSVILQDESVSLFGGLDLKNEFIHGKSQNMAWWNNFGKQLNIMCEKCKYSYEMVEKSGATATENHYSKENDAQTTSMKRKLRTENIYALLDSALMEAELWNGEGLRPYIFKINDHFVIDKSKHLENKMKELSLGTPMSRIIMEQEDITYDQAIKQMERANDEITTYPAIFNLNGEGAKNGDPTNPSSQTNSKQTSRELIR